MYCVRLELDLIDGKRERLNQHSNSNFFRLVVLLLIGYLVGSLVGWLVVVF